jgi:hypothetical protein
MTLYIATCFVELEIKYNNSTTRQTQLNLMNGTLHCYVFRFLRNHHQAIHTKNFKRVI